MKRTDFFKEYILPEGWSVKRSKDKTEIFLFTKEGLSFHLDFVFKKQLSLNQPLVKAVGFKREKIDILDVTAGWFQDAFLLSRLGCRVTAVESQPFVFHFVKESLSVKQIQTKDLRLVFDHSLNYLKNLKKEEAPDVIYMDPMFKGRKKSLSSKALRILRELSGETKNKKELFELSLKKAKCRVVVKRHRLESSLGKNRLCVFRGHSVCYDVFHPQ